MIGSILRGSDGLISNARAKVSEAKAFNREILQLIDSFNAGELTPNELTTLVTRQANQLEAVLIELDDRK